MITTTDLNQKLRAGAKLIRGIVFAVFMMPLLSMTWSDPYRSLLIDEDFQLENEQDRPALSSVIGEEPAWESFNEWQCYSANQIMLYCSINSFSNWDGTVDEKRIPSIRISTDSGEILEFDYDANGTFKVDCELTLQEWTRLLHQSKILCLFGAYLQDIAEGETYWILDRLKTSNGLWPTTSSLAVED